MRGVLIALGSTLWFLAAGMSDAGAAIPNLGIIATAGMACLVAGQMIGKGEQKMGKSIFEGIKVEAGQKINILEAGDNPHYIDEDGVLRDCHDKEAQLWNWIDIARGDYAIIPPYTADEIAILRGFRAAGYCYIARDADGGLMAYEGKPEKLSGAWNTDLAEAGIKREMMPGITWDDPEPLDIAAALVEIDKED